jgi:hypothetical protein
LTARTIAASIVVLPLAATVALSYFLSPRRFEGIEQTIAKYLSDRTIDLSYAEEIERESAPFVRGTPYEGHINARQVPIPNNLNIYVLKADPLRRFQVVRCNCAYVGHRIIVCDKRFLDTFAASLRYSQAQADSIPVLTRVNETFARVLFSWILGHEIGHAVLHDADGQFIISARQGSTSLWQRREREADEFAAAKMTPTEIHQSTFTLINMVFQVYHRAYVKQHPTEGQVKRDWSKPLERIYLLFAASSSSPPNLVRIQPVDGIHDPWVFRALRMASVLENRDVARTGNSSFLPQLASNFVVARDGFDVGDFCNGLPLRID